MYNPNISNNYNIIGDWSNGMIGVSKTFGGSSILSSPVFLIVGSIDFTLLSTFLFMKIIAHCTGHPYLTWAIIIT